MFYDNLRHFIVDSTKLPAMVLAWENFQEVFVMLAVVAVVFTSLEVFHIIAFWRHPSSFRELLRVLRFWVGVFLLTGVFYPTLLRLWLRWEQEHPIQDLPVSALTEFPFRLTHGLELLMLEFQDHLFINCASEPRIELKLNYWICFACSKSYVKTIKKYFKEDL